MKRFFKNKYIWIFLLFLILALSLISYSSNHSQKNIFTNILSTITSPIQKISYKISNDIYDWFFITFQGKKIKKQNENLQAEINKLRNELVELNTYKLQNNELLKMLEIKKYYPKFEFEPSTIIGQTSNDPYKSFIIDKGSKNNIKFQDCVITPDGFVGYVSKVNNTTSLVKTMLDEDISIGIYNPSNGETGILTGTLKLAYKNLSKMNYLSRQSSSKPNDIVVSSGIKDNSPKGILIGKILSIQQEKHSTSFYGVIQPFCDFDNLKNVFIIKHFSNQYVTEIPNSTSNNIPLGASQPIRLGSSL